MNDRNWRILLVAVRSGEGPLTEHITATQAHSNRTTNWGQSREWQGPTPKLGFAEIERDSSSQSDAVRRTRLQTFDSDGADSFAL
jgi:hypothetical protein